MSPKPSGTSLPRRQRGCLNPGSAIGRLAWLSLLSGAGLAATVWPGDLGGWWFHAAVFVWILTAIVWSFWLALAIQMVLAFRRMKNQMGATMGMMMKRSGDDDEDEPKEAEIIQKPKLPNDGWPS
ncbi:MAG: hypothetical protein AAB074_08110 [Planctomycetota bacterium]